MAESRALCGGGDSRYPGFLDLLGEDFPHASPDSRAHARNLLLFFSLGSLISTVSSSNPGIFSAFGFHCLVFQSQGRVTIRLSP